MDKITITRRGENVKNRKLAEKIIRQCRLYDDDGAMKEKVFVYFMKRKFQLGQSVKFEAHLNFKINHKLIEEITPI